ncbi:MAG: hypothetical protein V7K48_05195 [Nostoc sp.]|uniref:hypothetical protein n=1 Tax=Nostoc sp. TaxID=1180 RepID=UPI002FFB0D80
MSAESCVKRTRGHEDILIIRVAVSTTFGILLVKSGVLILSTKLVGMWHPHMR